MAITVQAGTGAVNAVNVITPGLPDSVIAGDLLILAVDILSDTTATATGYTEIFTDTSASDRFRVLTKTAGASETAPNVILGGSLASVAMLIRVRDSDNTPAQVTANLSSTTTASIDPAGTGSVKIGIVHVDPSAAGSVSWSGGATGLGEIANAATSFVAFGYKLEDSSGALTFTYSGSGTTGTLIMSLAGSGPAPSTFVPQIIIS